jgi:hypothetical protein
MNSSPLVLLAPVMIVVAVAFYAFIIWAVYKIATSLVKISRSMEEMTSLLQRSQEKPAEPIH